MDAYVLCGFKTCLLCGARQYQNRYFSWRVSYFCLLSSLSPSLPVFSVEVQEVDESLQAELLTRLTLGKAFKWAILGAPSALSSLFTPDGFLSLLVQITYQLPLSTSSFCMHPSICVLNQLSSYWFLWLSCRITWVIRARPCLSVTTQSNSEKPGSFHLPPSLNCSILVFMYSGFKLTCSYVGNSFINYSIVLMCNSFGL